MLDGPNSWVLASRSLVLAFAPVVSTKNEGLARKLITILLVPFYSQRSQFLSIFGKKAQEKASCAGALPDFGLVTSQVKIFWLRLGEYLYEASEKYILEGKIFKLTNSFRKIW